MLAMFLIVLGTTAICMWWYQGFIPDTDNDNFNASVEAAQRHLVLQMVKYQQLVSSIIVQDPDVEAFYSSTGGGGGGGGFGGSSNTGNIMVNLKPRRQRVATVGDIVNRLRRRFEPSWVAGIHVHSSGDRVGGAWPKAATTSRVWAGTRSNSYAEARKLERVIARYPATGCIERPADQEPRVKIILDRDRAAALNLNWSNVSSALYDAFGPQFASTIYAPYEPVPRAARDVAAVSDSHRRIEHDLSQVRHG